MFGQGSLERIRQALVQGPVERDGNATHGESACDPFYRAWLRSVRRELARTAFARGTGASIDVTAPRGWVQNGEWGDTAHADLEMLAFDRKMLELLQREAEAAIAEGLSHAEAAAAIRLLDECASLHEAFEELLLDLHDDPDRTAHAEGHRSLRAQREQLRTCHAAGDLTAARSLMTALRGWAEEHASGPGRSLEDALHTRSATR
jgi:hemerythrin